MKNKDLNAKILDLEAKIEKYNRAYYDENKSLISDYEYDLLKKELEHLRVKQQEQNNNDNINIITKTATQRSQKGLFGDLDPEPQFIEQKVGYHSNSKFAKITHKKRMSSLANALTIEEFYDFIDKTNRFLKCENFPESVCELKIDGLSFSAMYTFGKLKYVATRGDGIVGEDVTNNVLQIDGFPKELPEGSKAAKLSFFETRGEIYMPKDVFENLNKQLPDDKKFSNPRNAASGTLRQLDPEIVRQRCLKYYTYFIGESSEKIVNSQSEALTLLQDLNFIVNQYWKIAKTVEEIIQFHEDIAKIRYSLDCDIDGIVVKINNFEIQNRLGSTAHDPRWAIAYKFSGITAITKLIGITDQVGRTGIVTPVAELTPVNIGGVIVKRATLHNYDEVERLGISIGDLVSIKRSGDVIPKIVSVEQKADNGIKILPPKICSCCGSKLEKDDKFVAIYCPNHKGCKSQIIDSIRHFASRNGLDISGIGKQTINLFYDLGILKSYMDIFELKKHKETLEKLDGFGEKSTYNLLTSIEESKKVYFNKVLFALGIDEVGENVAKILACHYHDFDDLMSDRKEFSRISNINGFGEQIVKSLIDYFNNEENINTIVKLKEILTILSLKNEKQTFNGKSVVFTGQLQAMTRQQAKLQAEQLGYKVLTDISKSTTYLICGEKAGSKLKKAEEIGIKVLTEDEWIKMNNTSDYNIN